MAEVHLTRKEWRVLRALEALESSDQVAGMFPTLMVAEAVKEDPDEVGIILRRLAKSGLVAGHGSIGVQGLLVSELTTAGRQAVRARKPLTRLKARLAVIVGTIATAVIGAVVQAIFEPSSTPAQVTVVVVSAGAGSTLGILGGSWLQDVLP